MHTDEKALLRGVWFPLSCPRMKRTKRVEELLFRFSGSLRPTSSFFLAWCLPHEEELLAHAGSAYLVGLAAGGVMVWVCSLFSRGQQTHLRRCSSSNGLGQGRSRATSLPLCSSMMTEATPNPPTPITHSTRAAADTNACCCVCLPFRPPHGEKRRGRERISAHLSPQRVLIGHSGMMMWVL